MNIVTRVKDILLAPQSTWPVIEAEETSVAALYTQYIMILAAIQAVAGFLGMSLFGASVMGVTVRVPIMAGLVQMVLGYGMALAMIYVVALIADALAPSFGGQKNSLNALKLMAYASTAGMVGGIFMLIPALGVLTLLAGLYSLYLLYLGVGAMMKVPREKALPYTAVLVVCAIVAGAIAGAVLGAVGGQPAMNMGSMSQDGARPAMTVETPQGKVTIDASQNAMRVETPQGAVTIDADKMEAWSQKMEAAAAKLEKAQQAGDQAAMEQALKEMTALQTEQPMMAPQR